MKCIILLTLVALCYSYPYGTGYGSGYGYGSWWGSGKNFNVNQDGSIIITTGNGKMITISKGFGHNVVVSVTDPHVSGKQYYFENQKYQPSQVEALGQILSQYQGNINQNTYQQLLGDVNSAVQGGQLSNVIYEALQNLNQRENQFGQIQGQVLGGQNDQQQWQELQQAQQVQQLLQQQAQNQWNQQGIQQLQFPLGQTGQVKGYVLPMGVNQQEQTVEKVFLQNPQKRYMGTGGFISGTQGTFGQQGFGGKSTWNALINSILYGKGQRQNPLYYGQYQTGTMGQDTPRQELQVEGEILNQQNQIHQDQLQQQPQQQQMLQQQFYHQQQQPQLQGQQQYVQELQEQVQKEQQHVLGHQHQLQEQQKYNTLMNLVQGTKPFIQTGGQQTGFWQQQPEVYTQGGLYGVYDQGIQHHNIPLVF